MQPTASLRVLGYRHLRLTTKDVNKGFYKGNRTGSMGSHTPLRRLQDRLGPRSRTFAVPESLSSRLQVRLAPFLPLLPAHPPREPRTGAGGPVCARK
ncbi:hypothetical protein VDBG_08094 [Verticillium alfalfae VaMs.102]|uniref:Uncharacterized protein n=1 Tax=Verticillium alfalfae (strain VaMs.102 / ATCC MYA-4576 / FGSC 10136) TaxID=526221 RepID=C9ST69_VERA1|nr:hypothetical protein VDBG_08094 [Verticillium alfalfae VaMs.102]EEY21984.1 hypothetical protein VDBG_08094 [Verticillium alfalfae VaMs.102]